MAGIVLTVEKREQLGTGASRAVRKADLLPAVIYGGAQGPAAISLKKDEVMRALRSGKFVSHLVELDLQGKKQRAIPKAIQWHPVSELPVHIDLYRVEETSIIDVEVPVHFKNQEASPGLKRGGALNIVAHTLKLHVPAGNIPEEIVVDLTGLDIGAVIHVSNLQLPKGATPTSKEDLTIATLGGRVVEEAEPAAAPAPAAGDKKAD
ncbi:MAG: 50S ribosomal protein L25/general stress protein Ctc [Caulobacterales bacterium]